jgi:hypothetical protein
MIAPNEQEDITLSRNLLGWLSDGAPPDLRVGDVVCCEECGAYGFDNELDSEPRPDGTLYYCNPECRAMVPEPTAPN